MGFRFFGVDYGGFGFCVGDWLGWSWWFGGIWVFRSRLSWVWFFLCRGLVGLELVVLWDLVFRSR